MSFKQSLISNNAILLQKKVTSWQEAIKLGTDLLEASGAITPLYYQSIIDAIETLGPYIIIAPNLALPHARPENGVIKTAFALVTLSEPILFPGEEIPVDILITLAGKDAVEHLSILQEVTHLLEDDNHSTGMDLDKIRRCKINQDVFDMIDASLATGK